MAFLKANHIYGLLNARTHGVFWRYKSAVGVKQALRVRSYWNAWRFLRTIQGDFVSTCWSLRKRTLNLEWEEF